MEKPIKDKYYFSQSALKDMERVDYCPVKWKAKWIDKTIKFESTLSQSYGNYFEYLVIGASAKDESTTDLPRNNNGSKTAIQLRIEEQAEWVKKVLSNYHIVDTQVRLYDEDTTGILDILSVDKKTNLTTVIELKLTADVDNTRGDYSWGNHKDKDYIQLIHYGLLVQKEFGGNFPKLEIIVIDYSTKLGKKYLSVDPSLETLDKTIQRFNDAKVAKDQYDKFGWITDPSQNECLDCPLTCSDRFKKVVTKETFLI